MAEFQAKITTPGRSDKTRVGHKANGITTLLNGWHQGLEVAASYDLHKEQDMFTVSLTGGSGSSNPYFRPLICICSSRTQNYIEPASYLLEVIATAIKQQGKKIINLSDLKPIMDSLFALYPRFQEIPELQTLTAILNGWKLENNSIPLDLNGNFIVRIDP